MSDNIRTRTNPDTRDPADPVHRSAEQHEIGSEAHAQSDSGMPPSPTQCLPAFMQPLEAYIPSVEAQGHIVANKEAARQSFSLADPETPNKRPRQDMVDALSRSRRKDASRTREWDQIESTLKEKAERRNSNTHASPPFRGPVTFSGSATGSAVNSPPSASLARRNSVLSPTAAPFLPSSSSRAMQPVPESPQALAHQQTGQFTVPGAAASQPSAWTRSMPSHVTTSMNQAQPYLVAAPPTAMTTASPSQSMSRNTWALPGIQTDGAAFPYGFPPHAVATPAPPRFAAYPCVHQPSQNTNPVGTATSSASASAASQMSTPTQNTMNSTVPRTRTRTVLSVDEKVTWTAITREFNRFGLTGYALAGQPDHKSFIFSWDSQAEARRAVETVRYYGLHFGGVTPSRMIITDN